ncbi:Rha family transcriptional regulator [Campylobacter jejuni]|uniref:Rha family transcriptional regulator n=1 Tax=Campylobacter coli TaxID=195 RepID=UPI0008756989|nr:Rha family transcriptional regulator [Campylobacter coli]EAI5627472.1 phage regulatory protein [Campylobacter jejuni]EAJ9849971.1 phage regulatory protein [Campylobacter jejuni]EAK2225809.1 phage regulatory protein [Campylobacter jejuni]EDO9853903.1 phage regulatory protein [Campylobacter jejuni]EGL8714952.1 Rha family transcriptional regulator [Campylobacter jejuni]
MNNVVFINNQEVVFENKDEQVFCTSLDVAKVFGKQHKDILEIIRSKIRNKEIQNFNGRNFSPVKYRDAKGEMRPAYQLTKDGFSFIAMGLTGRKADKFKIEFINAFNEMENIIRSNNQTTNYSDYEFIKKQNEILNQITCTQSSTIYVLQDSIRFLNNTISSMKEINKELKKIAGIDRFL